jgi:hypothetical protein
MVSSNKAIVPNPQPISEGGTKANVSARPEGPRPASIPKPEGLPLLIAPALATTVVSAPSIGVNARPAVPRPLATPMPETSPSASPNLNGTNSQDSSSKPADK